MKKLTLLTLIFLANLALNAQVAVNTTSADPDGSAMLDVQSTTTGILIPRTDTTLVNNAGTPATGLIIYQSTANKFYYYNGAKWVVVAAGSNPVFERNGTTIRQVAHYDTDDFIIGRDSLPKNGEFIISDNILFFDKSKAAFRAGHLFNSANWSPDSIGLVSFAYGYNTKAKGNYSMAMGVSSDASGNISTALGWNTLASSAYETSIGSYNTNYIPHNVTYWDNNDRLFQIGNGTAYYARHNAFTIYKNGTTIIGSDTVPANGVATTDKLLFFIKAKGAFRGGSLYSSFNWSPDSIGTASFAYGYNTKAKGNYSTAMGAYSDASGYISTALGQNTVSPSAFETSLGCYNTNYTPHDVTYWNNNDRLFSIGNGTSESTRSNAFSIYKNGNVAIGNTIPAATAVLEVSSTTKGFLPPRMTTNQRDAISLPATGLIIYQTDGKTGLYSYNGSAWTAVRTTYSVGDFAQGGIVFWVDETGEHGLVCAKVDQDGGSGVRWYAGTNGSTQAKGDGPYAGKANTAIIIAAQVAIGDDGSTYAARICNELQITENGKTYGDWYLPSKQELNLMYQNKTTIDATATANGGSAFVNAYYWSSTERSDNYAYAWIKSFVNGVYLYGNKSTAFRVRAVRAF